ncbi:MAG: Rieske 2Fe-2S domain-containing protein [Chloroflexota bacterium]|nr:Rieske 2Fe-2S domain-containing protein [Chloroflexota bacterium]
MANPKSTGSDGELSPEQQKFLEEKRQQQARDSAAGTEYRSDQGSYRKSGRQVKEEDKAAKKAGRVSPEPVNRREFLTYAWGAALGLVLVEAGIASFAFALPRFKEGEFGGVFNLGSASSMPQVGASPVQNLDGAFWLVNDADGVRSLYRVCTHLGCLYEWKDQTQRFECPCHGSKFQHDGKYIEGPAPRSLDQFVMRLEKNGQVLAEVTEGGEALPLTDPDAEVWANTGEKLLGSSN